MAYNVVFTLTSAGSDTGPFNISGTTSGGSTSELANGVSKATLEAGYEITVSNDSITGGTVASTGTCTTTRSWTKPAQPTISLAIYGKDLNSTPQNVTLFYSVNSGGNINIPGYSGLDPLPMNCTQLYTITGLTSGDTVTFGTANSCAMDGVSDSTTCPSSIGGSGTTFTTTINGTAPATDTVAIAINTGITP